MPKWCKRVVELLLLSLLFKEGGRGRLTLLLFETNQPNVSKKDQKGSKRAAFGKQS